VKTSKLASSIADFFRNNLSPAGKSKSKLKTALFIVGILVGVLVIVGGMFVLVTYLIQFLWGWIVPDLFAHAVSQGYLAKEISWWTAFKILIVLSVLGSLLGVNNRQFTYHSDNGKRGNGQPAPAAPVIVDAAAVTPESANVKVFPMLVDPLTDRELEVLQLLAKGLTNQQIAFQIKVSESTVVYHIGHIFGKLRVNSRVEAAVWAKERGII
jgi:DNA-binding CsgD family transcriptional regulator